MNHVGRASARLPTFTVKINLLTVNMLISGRLKHPKGISFGHLHYDFLIQNIPS
jgi:hypothetical protein